jgi:hypothetical protein
MRMTAQGTSGTVQPETIDGNDDTEVADESEHESDEVDEDLYDEVECSTADQVKEGVRQLAGGTVDKTVDHQPVAVDKPAAIVNGPVAIIHKPMVTEEPAVSHEPVDSETVDRSLIFDEPVVVHETTNPQEETQTLHQIRNLVNGTTTDDLTRKDIPVQRRVLVEMENPQELPNRCREIVGNKDYGPESNVHDTRGPNGIQAVGKYFVASTSGVIGPRH